MRKIILLLFFSLAGAAANIFLNKTFAASGIGLPLYIDTVLTITVTLIGGLFWGCLTGTLTNIIGHTLNFWGWEGYLFTLCNILTAVIVWKFTCLFPGELKITEDQNKGKSSFKTYIKSLQLDKFINIVFVLTLLSFTLCIAISILGGFTSFLIEVIRSHTGEGIIRNPSSQPSDFYENLPLVVKEIVSRIPINIIDRIISVFAGFGIAWVISRLKKRFYHDRLCQNPRKRWYNNFCNFWGEELWSSKRAR